MCIFSTYCIILHFVDDFDIVIFSKSFFNGQRRSAAAAICRRACRSGYGGRA